MTRNRFTTVPAIALSAILGAGVLMATQVHLALVWRAVIGLAGIGVAILTAVPASLNNFERAERHRNAGARFDGIRRDIELLLAFSTGDAVAVKLEVERIRSRMEAIADQAPLLPAGLWDERAAIHGHDPEEADHPRG